MAAAIHLSDDFVNDLAMRLATIVAAAAKPAPEAEGFIGVDAAAVFLDSTPAAVRALVRKRAMPFHKTPNGRVLFDRAELRAWVTAQQMEG